MVTGYQKLAAEAKRLSEETTDSRVKRQLFIQHMHFLMLAEQAQRDGENSN